jgi:hypothetical protein
MERPHVLYHLATCSEHRLPTRETAPLTSRLCPPVHTNNVDAASTHVQISHHIPLWIFVSMLVRPGGPGVHSTSHGPSLCTCNLSGRDAVMMLSSWLWIFSSGVPRLIPTSEGPMDVFRYMKTLRSYLAITARLIRLPGFLPSVSKTSRQNLFGLSRVKVWTRRRNTACG